jgi:menaquinone-dependent protoporphyrinogen IX oxidase
MKSIVIYSKTGNTLHVAKRLIQKENIPLLQVVPEVDDPNLAHPVLKDRPQLYAFDHVIIGSPVHGFSLAKVMQVYLMQTDFTGKTIDLFVTHFFPFAWMGGNRTLSQMKSMIEAQGGRVRFMTSINWKNRNRENDIENLILRYTA